MDKLTTRRKVILCAVIGDYITNAKPVSSRRLLLKYAFKCSGATLRNELSYLEKAGLLNHPHTSAGRVPTELGYRYYVNELNDKGLNLDERARIVDFFAEINSELDNTLEQTAFLLSKITNYIGLALSTQRVYFSGANKLLDFPEFSSRESFAEVLDIIQNGYKLLNFFHKVLYTGQPVIKIGSENAELGFKDLSLVASLYGPDNKASGAVGILGPTRMNYGRAISAVKCVTSNLSQTLESLN
ncbi:MAG: hypothetical protein C4562_01320 [Actinobacteria bacterium]|nr:MAG: hypothetical protein C4562_01320 [Actinomycetota bacterium]